jgi:hypothetical protein
MSHKKEKMIIEIAAIKPWKVSTGHKSYRGGAGVMGDRRTKRQRTRLEQNRTAIKESI